jgi:hypothetical protein
MGTSYIVADRTLLVNWAIQIDDGEIKIVQTVSGASAEPIFEDDANPADNWILFVDDGEMGIEGTVTEQDDEIILEDFTTATEYQLFVSNGQFGWKLYIVSGSFIPRLTLLGVG